MGSRRPYDCKKLDDEGAWMEREPAELYDSNQSDISDEVVAGIGSHLETSHPPPRPRSLSPEDFDHQTPSKYHYPDPTEIAPQQPYHSLRAQQTGRELIDTHRLQTDRRLNGPSSAASGKGTQTGHQDGGDWKVVQRRPKPRQNSKAISRKRPGSPRQERHNSPPIRPRSSLAAIAPSSGDYDTISEFMLNQDDPHRLKYEHVQMHMPSGAQECDDQVAASQSATLVGTASMDDGPPFFCTYKNCKSKAGPWQKRSDRNKHESSHKKFHCRVKTCRHSFGSQKALDDHSAKKHAAGPDPRQDCPHPRCSESFARKDGRDRHVRKFHPELATPQQKRQGQTNASSTTSSRTLVAPTPTRSQKSCLPSPPTTEKVPRTASFEEFPPLGAPIQRAQTGR